MILKIRWMQLNNILIMWNNIEINKKVFILNKKTQSIYRMIESL